MPPSDPREDNVASPQPVAPHTRRAALTPEQRRFLGTQRSTSGPASDQPEIGKPADDAPQSEPEPVQILTPESPVAEQPRAKKAEPRRTTPSVALHTEGAKRFAMRQALVVIGALLVIAGVFYAGSKYQRVRYLIETRVNDEELEAGPAKYPDLSAEELVEAALDAERAGDWQGATERFIEAKRKDRAYPGILFRIGKTAYDRGDYAAADEALVHALRFGENIAVANHLRGLIAVRRPDLPAAVRFFEAAANAEPFVSEFFYFLGETLRLDNRPREAIRRYQQTIKRTPSKQDAAVCEFKIRLARMEAAEASAVDAEVEEKRKAGPLPLDWLMTDAALKVYTGQIPAAVQLISEARAQGVSSFFVTLAGDTIFRRAGETHPEIAALLGPVGTGN
jgi:tetratricopeptide (TPR) repeat protein